MPGLHLPSHITTPLRRALRHLWPLRGQDRQQQQQARAQTSTACTSCRGTARKHEVQIGHLNDVGQFKESVLAGDPDASSSGQKVGVFPIFNNGSRVLH
jgi:hypothetical protein